MTEYSISGQDFNREETYRKGSSRVRFYSHCRKPLSGLMKDDNTVFRLSTVPGRRRKTGIHDEMPFNIIFTLHGRSACFPLLKRK